MCPYMHFECVFFLAFLALGFWHLKRRRDTEVKLKANEQRLLEAHRIAHLASFTHDLTTGAYWWADENSPMFGLNKSAASSRLPLVERFLYPPDQGLFKTILQSAVANGKADGIFR